MPEGELPPLVEALIANGKLIAKANRTWFRVHDTRKAGVFASIAFVCPICGELWGRRYTAAPNHPEAEGANLGWKPESRRCERHGDGSLVISDYEWTHMLDPELGEWHFPLAWLAYELFLIIRRFP